MNRHDDLTAALVAIARRTADRLDEDRSKQSAADASHALRTLALMVEKQHEAMRKLEMICATKVTHART